MNSEWHGSNDTVSAEPSQPGLGPTTSLKLHSRLHVNNMGLHEAANHTWSGWKAVYEVWTGDKAAHKDCAGSSIILICASKEVAYQFEALTMPLRVS